MGKTIAVTGVTGAQGQAIAAAFKSAGHAVIGLTRRNDVSGGQRRFVMEDPASLVTALTGVEVLAVTSPIDHRPGVRQAWAAALTKAAATAGVQHIVLNTAASISPGLERPVAQVLREVRALFLAGPTPCTVIEPTVYLDNFTAPWMAEALAAGIVPYPAPATARVAWVSHQTLGAALVAAAGRPELAGRSLRIGGTVLSGTELVARINAHTGLALQYQEQSPDAFAAFLNSAMGAPTGDDIADFYRFLRDQPDALALLNGGDSAELGIVPESIEAWAARQNWPKAPAVS
ncbi:MAG: SDR family oxidoreductase [Elstera sp.]